MSDSPLVVLVHGAWHGGWCWAAVQADLDGRGIASIAPDLPGRGASTDPLGDLHDDVAAVSAVLDRRPWHTRDGDRPATILVGHSYAGAVITQAAAGRTDIAHLVYIASFPLRPGESVLSCLGSLDRRRVDLAAAMVPTADDSSTTLDPAAAQGAMYGECSSEVVRATVARLAPHRKDAMTQEIDGAPRNIPSTYVVCRRDRSVHPDHQQALAARCSHRAELDTDHSPHLSVPDRTAEIIACVVDEIVASDGIPR